MTTRSGLSLRTCLLLALTLVASVLPEVQARDAGVETLARGLQHPWAMAFLPDFERDRRLLVTERAGKLRIVTLGRGGSARATLGAPIRGVPRVDAAGQGGLLDVALDPGFADNRLVYRWRKLMPRPRHPQADVTARGAFKKSSAGSSGEKSVAKRLASAVSE